MSTRTEPAATLRFRAELAGSPELGIDLPKAAAKEMSGSTMVEGILEGFPFRSSVEGSRIRVSETLREAVGAKPPEEVSVELTRIGDEPEVRLPDDLRAALNCSPAAIQSLWNEITPLARREWVRWVTSAKQEVTRAKRIEVGMDKLSKGMRRPCCFPGLNFVTKGLVPPEETWVGLPNRKK